MNKTILFGKDAREKVKVGVNTLADAVAVTLGANGKNVLLSENVVVDYGTRALPIKVSKDGATVCRYVHLKDPIENTGAVMLREAAEKTLSQAGDGTTTSCVLARAMVNKGMEMINEGENSMEIKRQLDICVEEVVKQLKEMAIPINGDIEKIRQIATVSANNDPSIGNLVAEAFGKIGPDGLINIEEAKSVNTEIKIIEGFELPQGYISPFFITDRAKNICELIEPNILLYEKVLNNQKNFLPILEKHLSTGKPLLIICEDADGEPLSTLIMNVINKRIPPVCIVRCPMFTENKLELMEDVAACTGATYLTDSKGVGLERASLNHLGKAQKVIVTDKSCTIIGGEKDFREHENLLNDLRMNLTQEQSEEGKAKIEKRIARLIGGIAVIYVGGPTETEMKERVDRVDDAVRAAKSANEEGYIAGAGWAFNQIADLYLQVGDHTVNFKGWEVLLQALAAPFDQLCKNAGLSSAEVLNEIASINVAYSGFNAKTGKAENLMEAGIIDPIKVLRCSLQNAASVAGMLLTSECLIVDTFN